MLTYKGISNNEVTAITCVRSSGNFLAHSNICQILTEIYPEISVQYLPHSDLFCYICNIGIIVSTLK